MHVNKSLLTLHILSVAYGFPLESDMHSGFMHVYTHVCVRKYQTIYRDCLWLPTCKKNHFAAKAHGRKWIKYIVFLKQERTYPRPKIVGFNMHILLSQCKFCGLVFKYQLKKISPSNLLKVLLTSCPPVNKLTVATPEPLQSINYSSPRSSSHLGSKLLVYY